MEPNNNQPTSTNTPLQQPFPQAAPAAPLNQTTQPPIQPAAPQPTQTTPKRGGGKGTILLIIILLLIIGMSLYILFANNQLNFTQKTATDSNTSVVLPSSTPTPSPIEPQTVEEIEIESPEEDLKDLEIEVQAL